MYRKLKTLVLCIISHIFVFKFKPQHSGTHYPILNSLKVFGFLSGHFSLLSFKISVLSYFLHFNSTGLSKVLLNTVSLLKGISSISRGPSSGSISLSLSVLP